jgi:death-on-curing protein
MHSLARNHALVDGNKRLAWAATRTFCLLNDRDVTFMVDDAEQFVLAIARGDLDVADITTIIDQHLR